MFASQDDWGENSQGALGTEGGREGHAPSPQRKKRPTNMFKLFGRSGDCENVAPLHMFNISQDSMASQSQFSQFSQDFTDRFQQCNMGIAMDGMHSLAGGEDSMLDSGNVGSNGAGSNDDYALHTIHTEASAPMCTRLTQLSDGSQQNECSIPASLDQGPRDVPSFTHNRPTALEIPHLGLFGSSSLTSTGTPLSALSTSTPLSGYSGTGVFFNSSLPPPPAKAVGQGVQFGQMPPPAHKNVTSSNSTNSSLKQDSGEKERLINIPAPMDNPFLQDENTFVSLQTLLPPISACRADGSRQPLSRSRKSSRRPPQSIYVGAFRERPRYICDFEQLELLGEGTHSVVYRSRRRLDGRTYAVKKLKRKISGEKEGTLVVREAMAGAALQGCPCLVQYYSCWVDDHHLYLQTEDCAYGTMECFVGTLMPTPADMRVLRACQAEMDQQAAERADDSQSSNQLLAGSSEVNRDLFNDVCSSQPSEFVYSCSQDGDDATASATEQSFLPSYNSAAHSMDCANPSSPAHEPTHYQDFGPASSVRVGIAEALAWIVLRDVSSALQFMHSKRMAHLDVRPANIFLARAPGILLPTGSAVGARCVPQQVLTTVAGDDEAYLRWTNPTVLELQAHILDGMAVLRLGDLGQCCRLDEPLLNEGESRYLPREVLNESSGLNLASIDMFSLGATVYELLLGRQLGAGGDTGAIEWHELRDGRFNLVVENRYSATLIDMLHRLMHPNPASRPTATHVFAEATTACRSQGQSQGQGGCGLLDELLRLREENEHLRRQFMR